MVDMTNFKKSVKWYDENLATFGYTPGDFIVRLCAPREEEVCFHCHTDSVFHNPVPLFPGDAPFAANVTEEPEQWRHWAGAL